MTKEYINALFVFRRDLRLSDNTALRDALGRSETVHCCFIFDPRQVGSKNDYRSDNCVQFMLESLDDLAKQLKAKGGVLSFLKGVAEKEIARVCTAASIEAVFYNRDYTPFSQKRDSAINRSCKKLGVAVHAYDDALLNAPDAVRKKDGTPYVRFTPYYRVASRVPVLEPVSNRYKNYGKKRLPGAKDAISMHKNPQLHVHGGRSECQKLLRKLGQQEHYAKTHDIPSHQTTHLSAHNKFGTCSIREIFHAIAGTLGPNHPLLRQLYWRDFFSQVSAHYPRVYGKAFNPRLQKLPWSKAKAAFKKWCTGTTGVPIVDAGMRQLNATGFMHNRVRMIVASFLCKDLLIDWRWGEKYFAQKLVDYDPAVNNGNWQWCAGTGCDAQQYLRIFNPWLQQVKFDPDCTYIKTWVHELKTLTAKEIGNWHGAQRPVVAAYPHPMVEHSEAAAYAKAWYRRFA